MTDAEAPLDPTRYANAAQLNLELGVGPRARGIAAIHAYADLLAARPDLPMPESIVANHHTTTAEVKAYGAAHGIDVKERNGTHWADLIIHEGDVRITHAVLGSR